MGTTPKNTTANPYDETMLTRRAPDKPTLGRATNGGGDSVLPNVLGEKFRPIQARLRGGWTRSLAIQELTKCLHTTLIPAVIRSFLKDFGKLFTYRSPIGPRLDLHLVLEDSLHPRTLLGRYNTRI